jgi:hypothetical protein
MFQKVVNGYLKKDWVLGYLYRASSALWKDVAGLSPIEGIQGIENVQLDDVIKGHLEYRLGMPKILEKVGFRVWRDYFDDEEEEEEKDKLEMEEEIRRVEAEKQRRKDEKTREKQAKKGDFKASNRTSLDGKSFEELQNAGIVLKELETTLPTLMLDKPIIKPASPSVARSSVGRSRGN